MRISLFILFLFGTPALLFLGLYLGDATSLNQASETPTTPHNSNTQFYAALPETAGQIHSQVIPGDARPLILENYLNSFGSPLAPFATTLVEASDEYDLDFRLLVAISRQESAGCKIIPPGSYNCWGWGIHERGTLHFSSFERGIYTVAKGLRENYLDQGLVTPEQIMSKYTPSSPGTWSNAVREFMAEME